MQNPCTFLSPHHDTLGWAISCLFIAKKVEAQPVSSRGWTRPRGWGPSLCSSHVSRHLLIDNRWRGVFSFPLFFSFGLFPISGDFGCSFWNGSCTGKNRTFSAQQEMFGIELKVGAENWSAPPCLPERLYCVVAWRPGKVGAASPT